MPEKHLGSYRVKMIKNKGVDKTMEKTVTHYRQLTGLWDKRLILFKADLWYFIAWWRAYKILYFIVFFANTGFSLWNWLNQSLKPVFRPVNIAIFLVMRALGNRSENILKYNGPENGLVRKEPVCWKGSVR